MQRHSLIVVAALMTLLSTTAARADFVDGIVDWLHRQGYEEVDVTRTLLGRTRIVATTSEGTREVIVNPRTGEILRDVLIDANGNILPLVGVANPVRTNGGGDGHGSGLSGGSGGNGSSSNGEDGDDDNEDSGSSGSGSGSSDSDDGGNSGEGGGSDDGDDN